MSHEDRTQIIRAILLEDWNPVGFGAVLSADEYDAYIPAIIHLLEDHCTAEQLEAHLVKIEAKWFEGVSSRGTGGLAAKTLLARGVDRR